MQTIVKGKTSEVTINANGPVIIIGENINPTRRKKLITTLQVNDFSYVLELARAQIAAGADILDVNVGFPGVDDVKLLPEVIKILNEHFDIPLCLDTPNPHALAAGLAVAPPRTMVNSVNGEEKSLLAVLPIVKEFNAVVIALTMDEAEKALAESTPEIEEWSKSQSGKDETESILSSGVRVQFPKRIYRG